MGIFGGSKSTSVTEVIDQRQAATENAVNVGQGATFIQSTDAIDGAVQIALANAQVANNAVNKGFEFGGKSLEFAGDTFDDAVAFVTESNSKAISAIQRSLESVDEANIRNSEAIATTNKSVLDVVQQALTKVEAATRSDAADTLTKIAKYGAIAFGVFALAKSMNIKVGVQ